MISQNIHTDRKGPKTIYINCTMVDVRGDLLRPPHCTTPAAVKPLTSPCGCAGQFESYLVANPEDKFSRDEALIK